MSIPTTTKSPDVKKPIIYDQWRNRPILWREEGGGKRLVETAGYQTTTQRLEALTLAGVQLALARQEQYDADHTADPSTLPVTNFRKQGYDKPDSLQKLKEIQTRLLKRQEDAFERVRKMNEKTAEKQDKKEVENATENVEATQKTPSEGPQKGVN